jgi:hypothetical protein
MIPARHDPGSASQALASQNASKKSQVIRLVV